MSNIAKLTILTAASFCGCGGGAAVPDAVAAFDTVPAKDIDAAVLIDAPPAIVPVVWRQPGGVPAGTGHVPQLGPASAANVSFRDGAATLPPVANSNGNYHVVVRQPDGKDAIVTYSPTLEEVGRIVRDSQVYGFALRSDGNFIVTGLTGIVGNATVLTPTGQQLWKTDLTTRFSNDTTPEWIAVDGDDNVYVCVHTGEHISLSAAGTERWRNGSCSSRPIIDGNRVFVTSFNSVTAVDRSTGVQLWNQGISGSGTLDKGSMTLANGTLFLAYKERNNGVNGPGSVAAIDPASGTTRWTFQTVAPITAPIAADEHGVIVTDLPSTERSNAYRINNDGTLAWQAVLPGNVAASYAVDGAGTVSIGVNYRYVGFNRVDQGGVVALSLAGTQTWIAEKQLGGNNVFVATIIAPNGTVFAPRTDTWFQIRK